MFFPQELQTSRVNFLSHAQGLIKASERFIRGCKIGLRGEQVVFVNAKAPVHRQLGFSARTAATLRVI